MYRVIKSFKDLQDDSYAYHVGDIFPHEGFEASAERLEELSTNKNRRGIPLIEEVIEDLPFTEKEEPEEPAKEAAKEPEETPKPKYRRGKKKG